MFSSIRSRLWFSYALLIGLLLAVVSVALIVTVLGDARVYRTQSARLAAIATEVLPRVNQVLTVNPSRLDALLKKEGTNRVTIRLMVVDSSGRVIADSWSADNSSFGRLNPGRLSDVADNDRAMFLRDSRYRAWLAAPQKASDGHFVIAATPRPLLPIAELVRNEVIGPLLLAGAVALLVSFILAVLTARWIEKPLEGMVHSAQGMAGGQADAIPESGPEEVKQLARALNEMNRQVQAGQQSQRDFIANVSHELKTPLTSIQGFAQAIQDGTAQSPEQLRESAQVIATESDRMYRLVLDLLALTRLEGGTADLDRSEIDLSGILRATAARLAPQAQQAGVALACSAPEGIRVMGDADRLAQVFTNLVDNAIKFTPRDGAVRLTAGMEAGKVLVEVSDTGAGIRAEDKDRIFERFYQADRSRRGGMERGTGLGLPIALQIVIAHGGKIWVDSQPGQGSRFMVQLPALGVAEQDRRGGH